MFTEHPDGFMNLANKIKDRLIIQVCSDVII